MSTSSKLFRGHLNFLLTRTLKSLCIISPVIQIQFNTFSYNSYHFHITCCRLDCIIKIDRGQIKLLWLFFFLGQIKVLN